MPTTMNQFWHDHAGARWLAPFAVAVFGTVLVLVFMMIYPHI